MANQYGLKNGIAPFIQKEVVLKTDSAKKEIEGRLVHFDKDSYILYGRKRKANWSGYMIVSAGLVWGIDLYRPRRGDARRMNGPADNEKEVVAIAGLTQDDLYRDWHERKVKVAVIFPNGRRMIGTIVGWDKFSVTILQTSCKRPSVVQKNHISTMREYIGVTDKIYTI